MKKSVKQRKAANRAIYHAVQQQKQADAIEGINQTIEKDLYGPQRQVVLDRIVKTQATKTKIQKANSIDQVIAVSKDPIHDSIGRRSDYGSSKVSSKQQTQQLVKQVVETWQNTSWPISGKYKNKQLKQLPLSYLGWVIDNFQEHSIGYKLAKQELESRYHNMA